MEIAVRATVLSASAESGTRVCPVVRLGAAVVPLVVVAWVPVGT